MQLKRSVLQYLFGQIGLPVITLMLFTVLRVRCRCACVWLTALAWQQAHGVWASDEGHGSCSEHLERQDEQSYW